MAITLWDIFFIGKDKALICIPYQGSDKNVPHSTADIYLTNEVLNINRGCGIIYSISLPPNTLQNLIVCKQCLIAEGNSIDGFKRSYEGYWTT